MEPTTQEAWDVLNLVVGWVKHAETKAAATLAAAGVVGGVLYNLTQGEPHPSVPLGVSAALCGVLVFAAGFCAACALWPRLRFRGGSPSLLYFADIACGHRGAYVEAFRALAHDREEMLDQLTSQIWANALVAQRKFRWSNLALVTLLVSVCALACTGGLAFAHR